MALPDASILMLVPLQILVTEGVITGTMGVLFTVTDVVVAQVPTVYEISTLPVLTPVTTPEELTVAMVVLALLHTPLAEASLRLVVVPGHVFALPVITAGAAVTDMVITLEPAVVVVIHVALLLMVQVI